MRDRKKIEKQIQEITDKIVERFQPEKIILFGSYAWGEPTEDSDVDLFIIKDTEDTRQMTRDIDASILDRRFPIDLIVYTNQQVQKRKKMKDPFVNKIFNNGKVFYE